MIQPWMLLVLAIGQQGADTLTINVVGRERLEWHSKQPGRITVRAWTRPDLQIVSRSGRIRFTADRFKNKIEVHERTPTPGAQDSIIVEVRVPASIVDIRTWTRNAQLRFSGLTAALVVKAQNATVLIDSIRGAATLDVSNASVRVAHVAGDVTVDGTMNDLSIAEVVGNVNVTAVGGAVSISNVHGPKAFVSTNSGPITVSGPQFPAHTELESHNGDVTIRLAANQNASATVSSLSGRIRSAFAPQPAYSPGTVHQLRIGTGTGPAFKVSTFAGSITIGTPGR